LATKILLVWIKLVSWRTSQKNPLYQQLIQLGCYSHVLNLQIVAELTFKVRTFTMPRRIQILSVTFNDSTLSCVAVVRRARIS
jgi:hypothetical protein